MNTLQIDIINPKANRLLEDLADLNLISIRKNSDDAFLKVIKRIRAKGVKSKISIAEIGNEIEFIREKRYASKKG